MNLSFQQKIKNCLHRDANLITLLLLFLFSILVIVREQTCG